MLRERRISQIGNSERSLLKRLPFKLIASIIVLMVVVGGIFFLFSKPGSKKEPISDTKVKAATATQDINKEFTFPLKDSEGEEVNKIGYEIEKAELRDEIVVKGQKAQAVDGRTFLIISLKITNNHNQAIQMNTRDYVRLSVNGNEEEWLAPDIHNDPVEIQAISVKKTRLGFPINDSDKDLVLQVGEINGDKEKVELNL